MTSPTKSTATADGTSINGKNDAQEPVSGFDALLVDYNSEDDDDFDPDAGDDGDMNMDNSDEDEDEDEEAEMTSEDGRTEENVREEQEKNRARNGSTRRNGQSSDSNVNGERKCRGGEKVKKKGKDKDKPTAEPADENNEDDEDDEDDEDFRGSESSDNDDAASGRESEAGVGGLIKTRAQRAKEEKEKFPLASTATATANVDSLWESMNKPTWSRKAEEEERSVETTIATAEITSAPMTTTQSTSTSIIPSDKILIKRTYEFAGETHTEEKLVQRSSYEAKVYLASLQPTITLDATSASSPSSSTNPTNSINPPLRRPLKRASAFDTFVPPPNSRSKPSKAAKLNTLEKSRLDWAGYVDKEEGLADDLDRHSRSAGAYVERQGFLGRMEGRREEVLRGGGKKR